MINNILHLISVDSVETVDKIISPPYGNSIEQTSVHVESIINYLPHQYSEFVGNEEATDLFVSYYYIFIEGKRIE